MPAELIRTIELDPIDMGADAEPMRFRIEIFKEISKKKFFAKVYRWETFRISPTFPTAKHKSRPPTYDEEILIVDATMQSERFESSTAYGTYRLVRKKFRKVFGTKGA